MGKIKYLFRIYVKLCRSRFSVFGKLKLGLRFCGISVLFILFGILISFLGTQKIQAADSDVVINEVMFDPVGTDTGLEWVELYNPSTEQAVLSNFDLYAVGSYYTFGSFSLDPGAFVVVHINSSGLNTATDLYQGASGNMSNTSGTVALFNSATHSGSTIIDFFRYGSTATTWQSAAVTAGIWTIGNYIPVTSEDDSIGRLPNGQDTNLPSDWTNFANPTIGQDNSTIIDVPPPVEYPQDVLNLINLENALIYQVQVSRFIDGDTIEVTGLEGLPSTIRLLYVDTPEEDEPFFESAKNFTGQLQGQTIDLLISQEKDEQVDNPIYNRTLAVIIFQDQVFNTRLLEQGLASYYATSNSVLKSDAWLAILQQAQQERIGLWASAGSLIMSELLPDPIGSDAEGEWIEIYNPSNEQVILSRFLLDQYLIAFGQTISPKSYKVFHRNQTEVTLNNSGDSVKLFFPGGLLISETSYGDADEGFSWALIDNIWGWTATLTPGEPNILSSAQLKDADENIKENLDIPINSDPVKIKTGEFRNYENYLVTITGTVVETSGNTFYLDDGSGKAKVYIQAATEIDKPEMHKGDIFEVTGIVNLYRDNWRILPQKQEDVSLIKALTKQASETISVAKKSTAKVAASTKKSSSSTVKARSPTANKIAEEVAGAENQNPTTQIKGSKAPWGIQFAKAITGLALIFLIILIVRAIRFKKHNPVIGGNFGDDLT